MMKRLNFKDSLVVERLANGILKENPIVVLMLGLCPALAVTTTALNGISMGFILLFVLLFTNLFVSLIRNFIPPRIKLLVYIIIIAVFVTIAEVLIKTYLPSLDHALGMYLPLILVSSIIMSRVKDYATKNKPLLSVFDAIGMGLGSTIALMVVGAIREFLGAGTLFDFRIMPDSFIAARIFILAPGAFFILAALIAIQNKIRTKIEIKAADVEYQEKKAAKILEAEKRRALREKIREEKAAENKIKKEEKAAADKVKKEKAAIEKAEKDKIKKEKADKERAEREVRKAEEKARKAEETAKKAEEAAKKSEEVRKTEEAKRAAKLKKEEVKSDD